MDLMEALARLEEEIPEKVARAILSEVMDEFEDAIHDELDADNELSPELKAALHTTVGRRGLRVGRTFGGKVGFGVGRGYAARSRRSNGRSGVGLSGNNVHWFILGTQDRFTGKRSWRARGGGRRTRETGNPVRYSGRIQPIRVIQRAMKRLSGREGQLSETARRVIAQQLC